MPAILDSLVHGCQASPTKKVAFKTQKNHNKLKNPPDFLQLVLRLPGGVPQLRPPPLVLLLPAVLLRQERPQLLQGAPPTGAAPAARLGAGACAGVCAAGAGLLRSLILREGSEEIRET